MGHIFNEHLHENQKLIIIYCIKHQTNGKSEKGDGMKQRYNVGDIVFIFYCHPYFQEVANIQEAAVVNNPDHPNEQALFLFETFYPITNDILIFTSEMEAVQAYHQYFH